MQLRHHSIPHYNSWTEVKVLVHNVQKLLFSFLGGPIVEDGDREGMGDSNGVGHLQKLAQIMQTLINYLCKTGEMFYKTAHILQQ